MNKKLVKILAFFIFAALFFLISPRQILAICVPALCGSCPALTECADCTWCQEAPEPREDITGKVFNPVLPEDLSRTPGDIFLRDILQGGIRLAFVIGAIIFFFMLVIGGIKWISAGGDKARLEGAQKQITHALAGLAILLSTFAIIRLVGYLFGIDLLQITLPTL